MTNQFRQSHLRASPIAIKKEDINSFWYFDFRCDECGESFRLKLELRDHISEHYVNARTATKTDSNAESLKEETIDAS